MIVFEILAKSAVFLSNGVKMKLVHNIHGKILEITLLNENVDATNSAACKEKILDLIQQTGYSKVLLDLSHLQFIDSSGLGALLSIQRSLYGHGGKLKLANLTKSVQTVFEIVSMHRIFEIYPTMEDAVKSF